MNPAAQEITTASLIKEAKAFHLKKELGQHFLVSVEALREIVDASSLQPGERVIEIGPGLGFLTRLLSRTGASVTAIDLDRQSVTRLREMSFPQVEIKHGDFLQFDLLSQQFFSRKRSDADPDSGEDEATEKTTAPSGRFKVIGNVPYQITGPIIGHLLGEIDQQSKWLPQIDSIVMTVQYEVAKRMVAKAGDEEYSRVSLLIEYFCEAEFITTVPADAFFPPPKVRSAVVRLTPRLKPAVECKNPHLLRQVITAGFRQRRKMLRNSLSFLRLPQSEVDAVFKKLSMDPQVRAERLSLSQFAMLSDALEQAIKAHADQGAGNSPS